ncbi:MAG TPA: OsmC family protein [Gemmatimonadales bacterium]|jgi:putative redox protein|nr:OsmC family protein [Gemmatimonadales bacterium]
MTDDNLRAATLKWEGELRFRGGATGVAATLIDANGAESSGPMVTLLLAAAACSGADIVGILQKMQVTLHELSAAVSGRRAPEHPKRYLTLHFAYRIRGEGLDEAKARRAVDLSHQKYCSVLHSLNSDIAITYDLDLG